MVYDKGMLPNPFITISPYILSLILKYKYTILFPVLVIEGPVTTVVLGILASPQFNEFNIIFLYFFVIFSDICGDTMYYSIGRYAGKSAISKFKQWRGVDEDYELRLQKFFERYGNIAIVLGKITHGIGWPIMLAAGSIRMPYHRFITYCTAISIVKTAILLAIGYYYAKDYSVIAYYIGSTGTSILTFIIVTLLIVRIFIQKKK